MPLLKGNGENFVNVQSVFVQSQGPDTETGPFGQGDFKFTLPNYLNDVVALEMDNYQIPINALSQFVGRNKIDFRLRNPNIFGGQWKNFTAVLPETSIVYSSPERQTADLLSLLVVTFRTAILPDTDFGGKVDIVPIPNPATFVDLICRTLVYPDANWPGFGSTECEFLFGSGPNVETSAGPILGFDEIDYAFQPVTIYGISFRELTSDREAVINRFRYLDVFIDEFSLTKPFYRIYVPSITSLSTTIPEVNGRARLLKTPIRIAKTLTFHVRLQGGLRPATSLVYFFNLKVYTLKSSYILPDFNKRRTMYI